MPFSQCTFSRRRTAAASSIRGPTSVASKAGSPTESSSMAPATSCSTRGAISSCRSSRRRAEHRWPALRKAEATASRAACSGRAVESTIIAFSPPVSATKTAIGPSRAARVRFIFWAVAVDPVKATPASSGASTKAWPKSASPGRNWSASGGTPARRSRRQARCPARGVCGAALATTAFPAARAAATCPKKMARGKFHGPMQAKGPRPSQLRVFSSPVGPGSTCGGAPNCRSASAA
mmetsp:Transcript_15822/g.25810  ORF Transcript_15822/g.25810 Transcript_15822/m.25810 type:complete len:236 (+) Transcript_15822:741-1448(+)